MKRGVIGFVGAMLIGAAAFVPSASAATLVGDYQLQGTHASSGAGPPLSDIAVGNGFQSDTVMGVSRQVLTFPLGSGLQMSPAGLGDSPYSEVVTFRFSNALAPLNDYARILDSTNGTSDVGLYDYLGFLDFYDSTDYQGPSPVFADDTYATVALVVDSGGTRGYVNGVLNAAYPGLYGVQADTLRFFKDDADEDAAGAASCIRVYSGALTDAEIAAIGASPTCGTVTVVSTGQRAAALANCKKKYKKAVRKKRAHDALTPPVKKHLKKKLRKCKRAAARLPV